jgi:hypothetical protein
MGRLLSTATTAPAGRRGDAFEGPGSDVLVEECLHQGVTMGATKAPEAFPVFEEDGPVARIARQVDHFAGVVDQIDQ